MLVHAGCSFQVNISLAAWSVLTMFCIIVAISQMLQTSKAAFLSEYFKFRERQIEFDMEFPRIQQLLLDAGS